MKRIIILACGLLLSVSLAACGNGGSDLQAAVSSAPSTPAGTESDAPLDAGQETRHTSEDDPKSASMESENSSAQQSSPPDSSFEESRPPQQPESQISSEQRETVQMDDNGSGRQTAVSSAPSTPAEPASSKPLDAGQEIQHMPEEADPKPEPMESENSSAQQSSPPDSSSEQSQPPREPESQISSEERETMQMNVQVGNATFSATLEENSASRAFVELMKSAPVVIEMSDYAGFEKVGPLGTSLPASNSQTTTQSGDIVLYNGSQIVVFYGSNSWSYTRLGRIDDLTEWEDALGSGDVTITFSMGESAVNR